MTIIKNSIEIQKPIAELYTFLSDLNHHEQLMPEMIYNWTSTADEARFTIKNMAKLTLKMDQRIAPEELVCVAVEETPFAITLRWKLQPLTEGSTTATFIIEADLNMMMKMVAGGPLQKLVDHQVNKLKEILG